MVNSRNNLEPENTESQEIILEGIAASPGICIGKAYIVDNDGIDIIQRYHISESKVQAEKNRFNTAIKHAKSELIEIIEKTPKDLKEHANILETHVVLLNDKMLYGQTIEAIEKDLINSEWALRKVVNRLRKMFRELPDEYFKDRVNDIIHVSNRINRNLGGGEPVNFKNINKRVILVASDLSPAETSQIQLEKIMGFVTDLGGKTSHTGIIARTLEIPAVLGLQNVTRLIQNDDLLIVDGSGGTVVIQPDETTLRRYVQRRVDYEVRRAQMIRSSHSTAMTLDGTTFKVMGNIELPEEVVSVKDKGGDGIGLYRTEFQYMNRAAFPGESELYEKYKDVLDVISPQPVTIRTLDINGDKAVSFDSDYDEPNPALGLRAIRYCLKKPNVFMTQLRAILRVAAHGNVRILIPMISGYEEIMETKRLIEKAASDLESEGVPHKGDIKLGVMIEVPSAVIIADILAEEVDFFSIGTNDLIQYSMAIDRGNSLVAGFFNPLHPAVIRMISHVADVARKKNIGIYMCGEMASEPMYIPLLIGLGIKEFSMNPQSIPLVKRMVRSLNTSECVGFIDEVMVQKSALKILELIKSRYGKLLSDYEL